MHFEKADRYLQAEGGEDGVARPAFDVWNPLFLQLQGGFGFAGRVQQRPPQKAGVLHWFLGVLRVVQAPNLFPSVLGAPQI